ncbi:TPA: YadA-like family protein [Escherichia coli]
MNKIFKVIWNPATGSYSVASETAKSRGKKSGRSKLLISALVAGGLLSSFGALAQAGLDTGTGVTPAGHNNGTGWIAIGTDAEASTHTTTNGAATAVGYYSKALGMWSTTLGAYSQSNGDASLALGVKAQSNGDRSISMGASSSASINAGYSIAMGVFAFTDAEYAVALGNESKALGKYSLALGNASQASGESSIAFGNTSEASEQNAIALGQGSIASKVNSIALGSNSSSAGENAIALGEGSAAGGSNSLAFGSQSRASGNDSVALGVGATAATDNSVAIGAGSTTDASNTVSVGNSTTKRKIVNMAAGAISNTSTDAINGSQLYTISDSVAKRLGGGATVGNDGSISAVSYALKSGTYNNVGDALSGIDNNTLQWNRTAGAFTAAHGSNTTSKITNVAKGTVSATSTDVVNGSQLYDLQQDALLWNGTAFSAAHGTDVTSKITNVTAGELSDTSTDAVNGSQLKATKDDVAANTTNITNLTGEVAGNTTSITNLTDTVNNLGEDALKWDDAAGAFTAAHGTNATNKISNVQAGIVSSDSTDAINGSQLYGLADSFTSYLGGGADISDTGVLTGPTYSIGGTDYTNVGDALAAINTSFSDSLGDALLWDTTAGKFSAKHGINNDPSVITDVANGAVSSTSSDAINGSQLYGVSDYIADALGGNAVVNADGSITTPTYAIAGGSYNNVGDALEAIDTTLDDALLWDATANNGEGAYNASHDGKASIITNVADGNIGEGSTDAINGSQLFNTNMLIQQNSEVINQLAGNTSETYIEENGAGINYVRTNDTGLTFTDASAQGVGATAVGYNSVASKASSVAIGQDSRSEVETGIALGSSSVSSRLIVKGSRDTSVSEEGVVIGYDTTDGELLGALSIGDDGKYRQIINVADGSEAHDAVTVRQLQNAIGAVATTPTKYYHANSTAEDSLAVGEDSLAMGAKTIVNGNAGIGIGLNTLVLADAINGIAIGSNASANHANSIAMGNGSQTTRGAQTNYTAYNMDAPQNSVGEFSVGSEDGQRQITNVAAGSADTDAVNVGQLKVTDAQVSQNTQSITNLNNQVTNLDTRVTNIENGIGDIVTTGSTKYFKTNTDGVDANAQGKDSVAIGSGSIAAADNSVALGTGSVANEENTISVGSSTNQRRITNVAAGVNATDAVNVSQLKSSEAGGVRYDTKADGSVDYSNITLGGGNGGTTRISNVSAGVNNNDAVNYAQLKQSVQETKQYTDQRMVEMDNKLSKTESKLSGGIASAMAMTGLPQAYTPGASMASIGGGTYNGESAVALGVSMVSANGRWVYKLQGSTNSQGEYSAALGAGIQW